VTKSQHKKFAAYLKAMGNPVRLQILNHLIKKGECVCGDITSKLPVAASTASQHLKVLKEAGLITGTIDGPRRCYCINQKNLDEFRDLVGKL